MEMPQPAGRFNIVLGDAVQKRHLPWAGALSRRVLDSFNFRLVSEHKRQSHIDFWKGILALSKQQKRLKGP